jgi:hypothetical protein
MNKETREEYQIFLSSESLSKKIKDSENNCRQADFTKIWKEGAPISLEIMEEILMRIGDK